eukprot:UN25718
MGYPIELLKSHIEPHLDIKRGQEIYYSPECAMVDAQRVCEQCVELAVKNGVKFINNSEVVRLIRSKNKITAVQTKKGKIYDCDICIIAAGTYSQTLLKTVDIDLPMKPSASVHSVTYPLDFKLYIIYR